MNYNSNRLLKFRIVFLTRCISNITTISKIRLKEFYQPDFCSPSSILMFIEFLLSMKTYSMQFEQVFRKIRWFSRKYKEETQKKGPVTISPFILAVLLLLNNKRKRTYRNSIKKDYICFIVSITKGSIRPSYSSEISKNTTKMKLLMTKTYT